MVVISSREFRTNQGKFFSLVQNGEDVIVKSRDNGCFRLVPITNNDIVTSKPDLTERVCHALQQVKLIQEGKLQAKTLDELIDEL